LIQGLLNLMANARLVLTDSGGIQEETSILALREDTERPATAGTNRIVGNRQQRCNPWSLSAGLCYNAPLDAATLRVEARLAAHAVRGLRNPSTRLCVAQGEM
jgi:hypothetical protein